MRCKACKNKLNNQEQFCGKCGVEVVKTIKKNKMTQAIIACVCCFALILSGTIGSLYFFNKNNNSDYIDIDGNYSCFIEGFTDVLVKDEGSAIQVVASVGDALGVQDAEKELRILSVNQVGNEKYYKIQQYYNDIPVYGKSVVVCADNVGTATAMTSNFTSIENEIDINPSASTEDICDSITNCLDLISFETEGFSEDSLIIYETEFGEFVLAYKLTVMDSDIIVDAHTAKVLVCADTYRHDTAVCEYEGGTFNGAKISDDYIIGNYDKGVYVFNGNYQPALDGSSGSFVTFSNRVLPMTSKDNYFGNNDDFNASEYSKAVYLLNNLEIIGDYFSKLNPEQVTYVIATINNSYEPTSAFGTYVAVNNVTAYPIPDYYDAISIFLGYELCNDMKNHLDTIAHEFTHGVNHSQNALYSRNSNQTYALDEAYADIFGELIEAYLLKSSPDWRHGDRNIVNPYVYDNGKYPYPITLDDLSNAKTEKTENRKTFYCTTSKTEGTDYGHFASTIVSHCAYLMWNGIDGNKNMKISSDLLAELWYRSIMLLQPDADFSQCRNAVELSARIMVKNKELTTDQYDCVVKAFDNSGIDSAAYTNGESVKNQFNLSVLNHKETNDVNYKLEVIKIPEIKAGPSLFNSEIPELIMEKTVLTGQETLDLKDGIYILRITDIADEQNATQPINIKIVIDGENANATDTVTVNTDFTDIKTVVLNDKGSGSASVTTSDISFESVKKSLIDKYGLASQKEFVSCENAEVKDYPDDVFGIVSMLETDLNNDNIKELLVIRVAEAEGESEGKIWAEIYQNNNGTPLLSASQAIYDISFCNAANIYLFYSDVLSKYCIVSEAYSNGSYTGVTSWLAEIYTISESSIELYKKLEEVPTVGIFADFEEEFNKINVPFAKYCMDLDKRDKATYYHPLCEVEHVIFGDSGSYMTRNHKLKIIDISGVQENSNTYTNIDNYMCQNIEDLLNEVKDLKKVDVSDGSLEYSNKFLIIGASSQEKKISFISIDAKCNYSIHDVYVGEDLDTAIEHLNSNGWTVDEEVVNDNGTHFVHLKTKDYSISLYASSNKEINSISYFFEGTQTNEAPNSQVTDESNTELTKGSYIGNQSAEQLRKSIVGSWGLMGDYVFDANGNCYFFGDKNNSGTYKITDDKTLIIDFPWTHNEYTWSELSFDEFHEKHDYDEYFWYFTTEDVLLLNGDEYYRDGVIPFD